MQKNNSAFISIRNSFVYLVVALIMAAAIWIFNESLKISYEKVRSGLVFLTGLYLLFYYSFVFIQKKHEDKSGFIFLILMELKLCFIFGYLFLFLNPSSSENKREILLFLMNYFALLVVDMAIKIRLMK